MAGGCPHFLGIGASRTGTTWLYHLLWSHPSLWLPPLKELHVFDVMDEAVRTPSPRYRRHLRRRLKHYGLALLRPLAGRLGKGSEIKIDPAWDLSYFVGRAGLEWYRSLFAKAAEAGRVTGEITPSYAVLSPETIARIRSLNEDLRIIYFMRDPIDRAWSAAARSLPERLKRPLSHINERQVLDFFASPHCSLQSDYLRTLEAWHAQFPKDNIYVGCLEDIREDPRRIAREILRFLGVDDGLAHVEGDIGEKRNAASPEGGVPPVFERALAEMYEPRLRRMREELGGRAVAWHQRALRALGREAADAPEAAIEG